MMCNGSSPAAARLCHGAGHWRPGRVGYGAWTPDNTDRRELGAPDHSPPAKRTGELERGGFRRSEAGCLGRPRTSDFWPLANGGGAPEARWVVGCLLLIADRPTTTRDRRSTIPGHQRRTINHELFRWAKRGREETDPLRIINYRTDPYLSSGQGVMKNERTCDSGTPEV